MQIINQLGPPQGSRPRPSALFTQATPADSTHPSEQRPGDSLRKPEELGENLPQESFQTAEESDQAERIGRFVQEKKLQGAQHLRSAAGLIAGQLTGMAIGSMLFAPLAFKMGNLYIATGGAALTGGALALLGSHLASRPVEAAKDSPVAEAAVAAGAALRSLPKIAYPTLAGHTEAQKEAVYRALDRLPMSGATSAPTIDFVHGLDQAGAAGLATPLFSQSRIFLDHANLPDGGPFTEYVTIHEVGHTYDFTKGAGPVGNISHRGGGFGRAPFISHYAETNRMEDFAESYTAYHLEPERLAQEAPEKFAQLRSVQQPGVVDQALDRPSVRDAGKRIGTAFEAAPRLRNLLALGSSLLSPFQLYRGAVNYEQAVASGDGQQLFNAKMQMAMGSALFLPATAPLSLAVALDRAAVNSQIEDGTLTVEEANDHADKVLAVSTGPVGLVGSGFQGELKRQGLLSSQAPGLESEALGKSGSESVKSAAWVAGGFALGAAAGGALAPLMHASSAIGLVGMAAHGTWVGGLAGAAFGLGAHALSGRAAQGRVGHLEETGGSALTREDKAVLMKIGVPTLVGGAGGAVAGSYAGALLGQAAGTALAGSVGGVTGAALGQYVGLLGGTWAGSKGGARLGGAWAAQGLAQSPASTPSQDAA